MMKAIKLAKIGIYTTTPNPNVGCVIVKNDKIIGTGYHFQTGKAHAEIYALKMAGINAKGSTVYITLEPCNYNNNTPACCIALIKAQVHRVVIATKDPNPKVNGQGLETLIKSGIKITHNILAKEAKKINHGFFQRMLYGVPYITLKLASSLDGKIALCNGISKWISCKKSRQDVYKLRAQSSAILSTSQTVIKDNATLIVHWHKLSKNIKSQYPKKYLRQPIRIILDRTNKITPFHKIITIPEKIILIKSKYNINIWPKHVQQIIVPLNKGYFDIKYLFKILGKMNINNILIEAGSILSGFLILNNFINELIIYMTPKLFGHNALNLCNIKKINNINNVLHFNFHKIKMISKDLKLILRPTKTQIWT
ncbi:bifunctional diaminohydroxyphosphoribosylaminopyrimidine deaminase/5-amino-6-(5-phosphoribosylamino)uracil reductase RibD [Enterobacteriaceae endosymbiont of Neohaemonia nigricornis]|nr:bifunctional diaminohydroxyphosphoribosylaminopyrimidine deaminase/5-amino-6-(5-phosphoribosylamino)uracil reductase RibD [Enterobacteriaceae endosymbiont of Neohaemonia nigricornis]